MRVHRAHAVAASAVVLAYVLGGCSGDAAEPSPLPSGGETTPSPTAATSELVAPVRPKAMDGKDATSAKEFVKYWILLLNYSAKVGQSATLRQLSAAGCVQCTAIADLIDDVYQNGGRIRGSGWTTRELKVQGAAPPGTARIEALVQVQRQAITREAGARPVTFSGGPRLKIFTLENNHGEWSLTRLEQPE